MNDVRIHHVLKDGTQVESVEGHLIMAADHPVLYEVINRIAKAGDAHETVSTSD